jgi:Flp pilus assembly protein TadG
MRMKFLRLEKCKTVRAVKLKGLRKLEAEGGQALVELAVSVSILALLAVGAVEMGNVLYASIAVSDAAMAGVQYGTRNSTSAADTQGIENAAAADAPNFTITFPTAPSLSCICSDGSASTCQPTDCSGSNIETILTVETQATVNPLVHLPGLIPNSIILQGKAIQKVLE